MSEGENYIIGSVASGGLSVVGNFGSSLLSNITGKDRQREMLEYNSPVNQVKRLRKAGINPAFAMEHGGLDAGNAPSPAPAIPQFDMNPLAAGVRDGLQLRIQKDLTDSEVRQNNANSYAQEMANKFALQENLLKLYQMSANVNKESAEGKLLAKEIELRQKDLDSYDDRTNATIAKNQAEAAYLEAQANYQNIVNQFAPEQQKALIGQINAHTSELMAAAREHDANSARAIAEEAVAKAQKEGLDIDNDTKDALVDAIVGEKFAQADKAYYEAGSSAKFYYGGEIGRRAPLSGFTDGSSYNRHVNPDSRGYPVVPRKYRKK